MLPIATLVELSISQLLARDREFMIDHNQAATVGFDRE